MNETIFFFHLLFVLFFIFLGKKMGRDALIGLFTLQLIVCNLFVSKQIDLFGFSATGCDAFCVGCFFCLSMLQHLYGKAVALKTIHLGFFLLIFFGIASQFHLLYLPSVHDHAHSSYHTILDMIPKIITTSLAINFLTQNFVVLLNSLFAKFKFLPDFLKMLLPIAIAQLFDTIAFTLIALRHMHHPMDIIILSYIIKILTMLVLSPTLLLIKTTRTEVGTTS